MSMRPVLWMLVAAVLHAGGRAEIRFATAARERREGMSHTPSSPTLDSDGVDDSLEGRQREEMKAYADLLVQTVRRQTLLPSDLLESKLR